MPAADGGALQPIGPAGRFERELADTSHAVQRLSGPALATITPVLVQAQRETADALRRWLATSKGDARFTPVMHRAVLAHLERALHTVATLDPTLRDALGRMGIDAGRLAVGDAAREFDRFSTLFDREPTRLPVNAIRILATGERALIPRFRTSAARYANGVADDIRRELAVGLAKRETVHEMVNRLVRHGGPRGLVALRGVAGEPGAQSEQIAEGLFARYRYWAVRVVRTETQGAYNTQIDETLREAAPEIPGLMRRWDASADLRICDVCAGLHGAVAPIGGVFPGGYAGAPAHPNCRCRVGAWRASWGRFLDGRLPRTPTAPPPRQQPRHGTLPPAPYAPPLDVVHEPGSVGHIARVFRERGIDVDELSRSFDAIVESGGLGYEYPSRDPEKVRQMAFIRASFNRFFTERGMRDRDTNGPDFGLGHVGDNRPGRMYFGINILAQDNAFSRGGQVQNTGAITLNRVEMTRMSELLHKVRSGRGEATAEEWEALKLVLHEHGHSFTRLGSGNAYQGIGLSIEEVTNEVASRIILRDTFGAPTRTLPYLESFLTGGSDSGAYGGHIGSMRAAVSAATNTAGRDAGLMLERACVAFKSAIYDENHMENWAGSPEAMANIFARSVASVSRVDGVEQRTHDELIHIWGEYRQHVLERQAEERNEREARERQEQRRLEEERARASSRRGSPKRR